MIDNATKLVEFVLDTLFTTFKKLVVAGLLIVLGIAGIVFSFIALSTFIIGR